MQYRVDVQTETVDDLLGDEDFIVRFADDPKRVSVCACFIHWQHSSERFPRISNLAWHLQIEPLLPEFMHLPHLCVSFKAALSQRLSTCDVVHRSCQHRSYSSHWQRQSTLR